jgi:hypothetical protein
MFKMSMCGAATVIASVLAATSTSRRAAGPAAATAVRHLHESDSQRTILHAACGSQLA